MTPELQRGILRRFAQIVVQRAAELPILLACAGDLRWRGAWVYTAANVVILFGNAIYVLPRNPEVIAERGKVHEGTRTFDKVLIGISTLFYLALLVVAALDAGRFRWAPLAEWWAIPGFALLVLGSIPVTGAMAVNRNLETTVRIQTDRGHAVATTGPYRWVRHPMYAGMLLFYPAGALLLGSGAAFIPLVPLLAAAVVRTALEDRTLQRDLPGYAEYAKQTRWRLVPWVW